jgi:dihydropyrimidine dehydrogenase (NAD+) subunit PreA
MSSADLSVDFAGLTLRNPLIVTASDATRNVWQLEEAEKRGAAAVIVKAISIDPIALQSRPRFYIAKGSVFGFGGSKRLTTTEAETLVIQAKKSVRIPIGVNIIYSGPQNLDIYISIAQRMQEAGADFIEINFFPSTMKPPENGSIPDLMYEGLRAIKEISRVPVMAKLTAEGVDVVHAALAMERGGADAIHAIDAISGAPMIDIHNEGKLLMQGANACALWLSGDYLRPIAQASVVKIARAVKTPILGTGGVMDWTHVVEMIMFGASATGLCTNVMINGFEVLTEIEKKLITFMDYAGFRRIQDFKGLALANMRSFSTQVEILPVVAEVDEDACNGCGLCVKPAHCGLQRRAMSMKEGKAEVEREQCLGCGTCCYICPMHAISMV